jgi:hypothetical protein
MAEPNAPETKTDPGLPATTSDQVPARAPSEKPSFARRALEWLWLSGAMARVRREVLPPTRALELKRRAQLCLELGRKALEPLDPLEHGPADAVACELCREAVYWALEAQRVRLGTTSDSPAVDDAESALPPATVWAGVPQASIDSFSKEESDRQLLSEALKTESFVQFAEMPKERLALLAGVLSAFASSLLKDFDAAQLEVERIWLRRCVRVGALMAALVGLCALIVTLGSARDRARDLASGKPWLASSQYPAVSCVSPQQECTESPAYFFHTNTEQDPWLELDLEATQRVSELSVTSRTDCCNDRGLPLVVEVSKDHQTWTEVARRTTAFSEWKTSFPTVEARWVRLRAVGHTMLHLKQVKVLN